MTTTLDTIESRLHQDIGDYIEVIVTTNINADTLIVSTHLANYDNGRDDRFNGWYVYITDKANIGVERLIADYDTSSTQITVQGANLADDTTNAATIRVYRHSRLETVRAVNNASRYIYPSLFKEVDDMSLITGNILPPFNWSTTALLDHYTEPTGTLLKVTSGGTVRNGPTSAKVTGSGANDDLVLDSDDYPRLLDIMGKSVNLYCWVDPEVANDAYIEIYTLADDGTTAQTLTSTTTNAAAVFTLLKLEDQAISDDLHKIEIRLRTTTTTKYIHFEPPRLICNDLGIHEYLLPTDLQTGTVRQVYVQTRGYSDDICDDLHPRNWDKVFDWKIINDGTDRYLRLESSYPNNHRIRLIGDSPLETFTALTTNATETISLTDGRYIDLLIARSKYELFKILRGSPASEDVSRYKDALAETWAEYMGLLSRHKMTRKTGTLKLQVY